MEKMFNIPSKIENLRIVEKAVDEISTEYNLSSELYGNVLIATIEAANNAILHGNKLDEAKNVNIRFKIEEKYLSISVKDQGDGFDYSNIPDPTAPENIEKINGRGVFLMERLSDKMVFSENGSKVEMLFNI
ncbi:MAG TPA: ATP-binding protein [Bacteroidales bacterium]|jgi:Anti-sigma regulatory factor (Ser/Thr protein kinase)